MQISLYLVGNRIQRQSFFDCLKKPSAENVEIKVNERKLIPLPGCMMDSSFPLHHRNVLFIVGLVGLHSGQRDMGVWKILSPFKIP